MKRVLAAFAAFALLVAPAHAEIAVVYDAYYDPTDAAGWDYGGPYMQSRMLQAALDVLNRTNACYTLVPIQATKTSLIADGIVQSGVGTGSSHTYDGVLWLNWNGRSTAGSVPLPNRPAFTGCYPCSLTLTGNALSTVPSVPQLLTFGAAPLESNLFIHSTNGLRCSTGVSANAGAGAYGHGWEGLVGDETHGWTIASNRPVGPDGMNFVASANVPRRGFRGLVKSHLSALYLENDGSHAFACSRCDSALVGSDAADTLSMWEIPAGGTENAAAIVFAYITGAGPCTDSSGVKLGCEFDAPAFLLALARLDSLTNGGVWCRDGIPLRAAVTIDGAFSRGARKAAGGGLVADSAVVKASLDSLAMLGIPITVGVNVDSISTLPYQIAWWRDRLPNSRFSPQAWDGVNDTTTAGLTNSTTARPIDVFGRFRTRKFYGPYGTTAADTSVYAGLRAQRAAIVSTFGEVRTSRFLMAPLDDYTPRNLLWSASGWDSLLYAISEAGYLSVRTDVHSRAANLPTMGGVNRDLMLGGVYDQSRRTSAFNDRPITFLGQTGHNISGGHYSADTTNGAVLTFGTHTTNPNLVATIIGRFWAGFVHEQFTDYDWFPHDGASLSRVGNTRTYEDMFVPFRRANVLKLHVSDLSGLPDGPPARPGWWAVKSIAMQFRAINKLAGRTVCAFDWPENIAP